TEPKGRGDNPELGDTLFLEFYSPTDSVWSRIWFRVWNEENHQDSIFVQNIIQINEDKYLKKGFRFRFRNIVSLSSNKEPSEVINVDHWHIDYVYLNTGRSASDLNPKDISFIYPMASHLKRYESMPWKHFLLSPTQELATNVNSYYKNNDNIPRLVDSLYFVFYDNSGNEPNDTLFGGAYDINPNETRQFNPPFTYTFLTNTTDSASYTVKGRIVTDDFDFKPNNEVSYIQRFYDYYAYDDGTAEASYGFTGDGAQNAQLAYKFDCIKQDTLKAIQMYFSRSLNNKSQKYFYLTIWDDNNGVPGKIIYQREAVQPEYENELNKFHTYFIDDTTLVLNRVFYVGWIQTTSDMLNLGLDLNRERNENIFFNLNGFWENSNFKAALMIRPFFGKKLTTLIEPAIVKLNPKVVVFPNPTRDEITINISNLPGYQKINVQIFNLSGEIVHQLIYQNQSTIDLSNLNEGIYLLRLSDKSNAINYTQKIIKLK
ncbi:MAG: T9SS type A sorting domain-containing protein, partial [Bacteroidales bacterium]|nr:T9SS type A sorting domain-containing protein [Bacteroidales bacterium]